MVKSIFRRFLISQTKTIPSCFVPLSCKLITLFQSCWICPQTIWSFKKKKKKERKIFKKRKQMCTHESKHNIPCLHCQPHSYIRMVQHMIERCILLRMSRDECVKALDHHASILPLVTLTVWRGLQKENKDFFETYGHFISSRPYLSGYVRRSPRFAKRKK